MAYCARFSMHFSVPISIHHATSRHFLHAFHPFKAQQNALSMKIIESRANPIFKRLMELQNHDGRKKQRAFLAETNNIITTLIETGFSMKELVVRSGTVIPSRFVEAFLGTRNSKQSSGKALQFTPAMFNAIASVETSSGVAAVFELPQTTIADININQGGLLLDAIQEPGNAGALMRTAAVFGMDQVILLDSVDAFHPKTIRASVGAIGALKIVQLSRDEFLKHIAECQVASDMLDVKKCKLTALMPYKGQLPETLLQQAADVNRWIVIGNESHGISENLFRICHERCSLPMTPGSRVKSLNAAVAGSIACYLLQSSKFQNMSKRG